MRGGTVGEIRLFAGSFSPYDWLACEGQEIAITSDTQALYAILGTEFGGDGRSYFNLPDLRGRAAIHPSATYGNVVPPNIAWYGGAEQAVIPVESLPSHTHTARGDMMGHSYMDCSTLNGNTEEPDGAYFAVQSNNAVDGAYAEEPNNILGPVNVTGTLEAELLAGTGGEPIDIREPYLALTYIICVKGLFPQPA